MCCSKSSNRTTRRKYSLVGLFVVWLVFVIQVDALTPGKQPPPPPPPGPFSWRPQLLQPFWKSAIASTTTNRIPKHEEDVTITTTAPTARIRIRKTIEDDVPEIARILATAATTVNTKGFRGHIDRLWAQNDIEHLLRIRCRILRNADRTWKQQQQQNVLKRVPSCDQPPDDPPQLPQQNTRSSSVLEYWWRSSQPLLASDITRAAFETGEDNVWRYLDPVFTPPSWECLQHVQMTAIQQEVDEDDQKKKGAKWTMTTSTQIVGFVEIAMLRNPVLEQQLLSSDTSKYLQQQQQSSSPRGIVLIRTDDDDDDDDATKKDTTNSLGIVVVNNNKCFTPAITNLGVAPSMRRRGIAQRLIRVAERYVKHHWERPTPLQQLDLTDDTTTTTSAATTPMGLYVDITNQPAIALYEKCGYQKRQMVQPPTSRKNSSTTGDGPTMWYMQKVNAMT